MFRVRTQSVIITKNCHSATDVIQGIRVLKAKHARVVTTNRLLWAYRGLIGTYIDQIIENDWQRMSRQINATWMRNLMPRGFERSTNMLWIWPANIIDLECFRRKKVPLTWLRAAQRRSVGRVCRESPSSGSLIIIMRQRMHEIKNKIIRIKHNKNISRGGKAWTKRPIRCVRCTPWFAKRSRDGCYIRSNRSKNLSPCTATFPTSKLQ